MSSKTSDNDEVTLLMQQKGLTRVQATKMLYEMAKQKKKEEAAAAAKPVAAAVTPTQEDGSVVKKHIERYSSLKDVTAPVPSQIHEDIDLTTPRPTYKLEGATSFRYSVDGTTAVNAMAASLESKSSKGRDRNGRDEDGEEDDEEVVPFDIDKMDPLQMEVPLVEASPTGVAGSGLSSGPARRRSSNSALNLRPLARLHPDKFQGDGAAGAAGYDDSDGERPGSEVDYQSGNSSDAEGWEEPAAEAAPAAAPALAARSNVVLTSKSGSSQSLASKLMPPVAAAEARSTKEVTSTSTASATVSAAAAAAPASAAPAVSTPPPPVFAKRKPMSPEDHDHSEVDSFSRTTLPAVPSFNSGTAKLGTTTTTTTTSSNSSSSESKTVTSSHSVTMRSPPPVTVAPQLPHEEMVALLNSGKQGASPPNSARSSTTQETATTTSMEAAAAVRAADVMNVKVGNKKLTVRASFTNGSGGGPSIPPTLAAASAAAAAPEPPPPAYTAEPPPSAYDAPPPAYAGRPMPPVPAAPPARAAPVLKPPTPAPAAGVSAPAAAASPAHEPPAPATPASAEARGGTVLSDVEEEDENYDSSEEVEGATHEERVAAMMTKYRRRSRMKRDSLPAAFKDLSPIDPVEIARLMAQEQREKEKSGSGKMQPPATAVAAAPKAPSVTTTATTISTSSSTAPLTLEIDSNKPIAQEVAAVMNKTSTDLIEELISQGYSRENAIELAKEIELDRRGERYRPRQLAPAMENSPVGHPVPRRSITSASGNTATARSDFYGRSSFDRSFEDDTGSVVSNLSGVSRASSYCESDKLLMNLLLSQQKSKYGVNMYESLTNQDEPAIQRYMSKGCTLDQAVLKVFEQKYGTVENQVLPKTVFPGGQTGAAKLALTGDDPLEMVDTMHAEIELLMLSAGVTRDVAVKMLLSKVAKEKALQQQGGGGLLGGEVEHHLHKASSMSAMLPTHHHGLDPEPSPTNGHGAHGHTLHATRSMYTMHTSDRSVGGASVTSGSGSRKTDSAHYTSHGGPQHDASFPTQYPPHSSGHGHHTRHGHGDDWAAHQRRRPSGSGASVSSVGIASVNSGAGRMSVNSDSKTQEGHEYMNALLREQEAMFGVNMFDYLAPDDPEVARLMAKFGFSKTDAMIAVFQQFPPPIASPASRRDGVPRRDTSRAPPVSGSSRPPPASSPMPSPVPHISSRAPAPKPAPQPAVSQEEDDLQRALRLSMLEHNNNPGAVSVPGTGSSARRPSDGSAASGSYRAPNNHDVTTLMHMGFTAAQAQDALRRHNGNVELAANYLVGGH